jgi:hypothetical protein
LSAPNRPHRPERTAEIATIAWYVAGESGRLDAAHVTARLASFGEANADPGALIPGIRPDLLLIKQVDQVGELNGRLPPAGGSPGPSPHFRITYSAPARMPVGQRTDTILTRGRLG